MWPEEDRPRGCGERLSTEGERNKRIGGFEGMGERVEFETRLEGQQKTVGKLWRACCLSFAMISVSRRVQVSGNESRIASRAQMREG